MSKYVYVFMGENSILPSGIFSTYENGKDWIVKNSLTGILNKLPLDIGLYDWAISKEYFEPKKSYQREPKFIQSFTSASVDHWHFENGIPLN